MVEYVIAAGFFFIKKNGSIELSLLLYYFFAFVARGSFLISGLRRGWRP